MRCAAFAIVSLLMLMASMPDANAVVCARGVYRAGCAGAGGAVVVRRPVAVAPLVRRPVVVTAVAGCRYVRGARVCG
jgi:hypothetical protein